MRAALCRATLHRALHLAVNHVLAGHVAFSLHAVLRAFGGFFNDGCRHGKTLNKQR
jgi:hypothetical protein